MGAKLNTRSMPVSAAADNATSRTAGDVNRNRGFESVNCFTRSSRVFSGLAVVTIAPSRASASTAST